MTRFVATRAKAYHTPRLARTQYSLYTKSTSVQKVTQKEFYKELHKIADTARPKVQKAFLQAVETLKKKAPLKRIAEAVASGDFEFIVTILGIPQLPIELRPMFAELQRTFLEAALAQQAALPEKLRTQFAPSFDLTNPLAVDWMRNKRENLIQGITDKTFQGVRKVVSDSLERGGHPYQQAKRIRTMVGLTDRQATAVQNFWDMLETEGKLSDARIQAKVQAYIRRQLNFRARNIARTETISAANAGQQSIWDQATADGLLDRNTIRRIWIVTPDDRLCPICEGIARINNPDGVTMDQPFQTATGKTVMFPPAHPSCRCAMGLKEI